MRAIVAALVLLGVHQAVAQTLTIRFLDVGQGDATLVVTPEGKRVLVDAGPAQSAVVPELRAAHVDTIDLAVASHNHEDHIGGMAAVLTSIRVRYYLDNGVPQTTATYQRTITAVETSGAQYLQPTARTITVGTVRFRILPPPPGAEDQNNHSVGVLVQFGEFRALLTGDSELGELDYWLAHDSVPHVQVLKVAHHGSSNGTSAAWVQRTRPQVAVISVGAGNGYGHPSAGVVAQWASAGAQVLRTDEQGTVEIAAQRDGTFRVATAVSRTMPRAAAVEQPRPGSCCRVCTTGRACGNSCISRRYTCRQPPGCACDARP